MKSSRSGQWGTVLATVMIVSTGFVTPFSGTLFGTDANAGNLITVDLMTGAGTVIGNLGFPAPSLATDPTTGVMYAGQGAGTPFLYTVDPATGAATLVGDTLLGFAAIGGMDFRADGTLFAAANIVGDGGSGSETLVTIDPGTAVGTIVGPFGPASPIEGIEAIAFDSSGTLWGASTVRGAAGPDSGLFTIDTGSGEATFVATIADAAGNIPSGGVSSLQFRSDGTLFGGTARDLGGAGDGGRLITIDPATGVFSFVGKVGATSAGSSLGGLAGGPITAVPTVSPLGILVMGVIILVGLSVMTRRKEPARRVA